MNCHSISPFVPNYRAVPSLGREELYFLEVVNECLGNSHPSDVEVIEPVEVCRGPP